MSARPLAFGDDSKTRLAVDESVGRTVADDKATVTDEQWIAAVPETEWQYIVIHHSATKSGTVAEFDAEHRKRKDAQGQPWLGIAYHFVIGNGQGMADGAIEPTFRWTEQIHGAHSGNELFNARGIGICLVGNFDDAPPTAAQIVAVEKLTKVLTTRHRMDVQNIIGHSSVKKTSCPGRHFDLTKLRGAVGESNR